MKQKFDSNSYPLEVQEKVKKNLVWLLVLSIAMMFAGLTSAYFVSMGGNFWVKIKMPIPFFISTALIIISSITLFLAGKSAKRKKIRNARIYIVISLVLGIGFGCFQFYGFSLLVQRGANPISQIIVDDGRYGDYYELKKNDEYFVVTNNQFYYKDEKLEGETKADFQNFAKQLLVHSEEELQAKNIDLGDYTVLYKSEPLALVNGTFIRPNGEHLVPIDFDRLYDFAKNIVDDRADFFVSGELGKDFKLFYNRNELDYDQRTLMYKGHPLSANLQNKLLRGNTDKSTQYFYLITVLHILHVLAGVIMLIIMSIRSYPKDNAAKMAIALKSGSIFWHFLGILWLYLFIFLLFIH